MSVTGYVVGEGYTASSKPSHGTSVGALRGFQAAGDVKRLYGKTVALATGRDTEMEQKAGGDSGTEPGPQGKRGGGMVQFIVRKQSLCMVEAEKVVLRGARASPSVGWASWGPRMNSKQKQGAAQQDLSCGQAQELPLEGTTAAPGKLGRGRAALHT